MEDKYLYPDAAVHSVGSEDSYRDYMLSQVLACHGCTIRRIESCNLGGKLYYRVRWKRHANGEEVEAGWTSEIGSVFVYEKVDGIIRALRADDLRLRYYYEPDGTFKPPVWIEAFCYRNTLPDCPMLVLRSDDSSITII